MERSDLTVSAVHDPISSRWSGIARSAISEHGICDCPRQRDKQLQRNRRYLPRWLARANETETAANRILVFVDANRLRIFDLDPVV
jgi:hypothetical protein